MATFHFLDKGIELTSNRYNGTTVWSEGNAVTLNGKTYASWRLKVVATIEGQEVTIGAADFDSRPVVCKIDNGGGSYTWLWLVPYKEGMSEVTP